MAKNKLESLRKRALELGAKHSKVIKTSSVKTAAWVRNKCQYGCDGYGACFTCPPNSPTPQQTRRVLDSFSKAILIHCDSNSEKDISDIALKLEKEAFFAGFYQAFAMGAGPCRLCASCNLKGDCRHAYEARPSMEACGIDVYKTARSNGFKIQTLKSHHSQADYFSLVLIE